MVSSPDVGRRLLEEAIGDYETAINILPRDTFSDELRMVYANLGYAYQELGSQSQDLSVLRKAAELHRIATTMEDRDLDSDRWANSQNNLGNSLTALALRSSVNKADLLRKALEEYHNAAQVFRRRHSLEDWAMVQNNIANRNLDLAELTTGTGHLVLIRDGIAILKKIVESIDRTKLPSTWALTQNNLGLALRQAADSVTGPEAVQYLSESVEAFEIALEVSQELQGPRRRADIQNNLGNTLVDSAEKSAGRFQEYMERARKSFEAALEVYTFEDSPAEWLGAQLNFGKQIGNLGKRVGGPSGVEILHQAVDILAGALQKCDRFAFPFQWASFQSSLSATVLDLAVASKSDRRLLGQAVGAARYALEVFRSEEFPQDWARAYVNLANALVALSKNEEMEVAREFSSKVTRPTRTR